MQKSPLCIFFPLIPFNLQKIRANSSLSRLFAPFPTSIPTPSALIVPFLFFVQDYSHEYTGEYLDALCHATLDGLKGYNGPYCIESFDPRVVKRIRKFAPQVLRGQLVDSYRAYRKEGANPIHAFVISHCFGNFMARPDFIAWCPDKQNWAVRLCARLGAMMVMWTALPEHDQAALEKQYDAVIFQWYHPEVKYK